MVGESANEEYIDCSDPGGDMMLLSSFGVNVSRSTSGRGGAARITGAAGFCRRVGWAAKGTRGASMTSALENDEDLTKN